MPPRVGYPSKAGRGRGVGGRSRIYKQKLGNIYVSDEDDEEE